MHVRALAGAGLAAALTLTACGGSGSSATLTKADWVTQADAICADLSARTRAVDFTKGAQAALDSLLAIADDDVPKLEALKAPAEIQADATALTQGFRNTEKALRDGMAAKKTDNKAAYAKAAAAVQASSASGRAAATRLGADACAKAS
jgi:hypothetical protein